LSKEWDNQILKYDEDALVFSSIVKNNSQRIALLPEQTAKLCIKFGLPMASTKSQGICSSYDELCDYLYAAYCETAS